jgi:hypothetical protein
MVKVLAFTGRSPLSRGDVSRRANNGGHATASGQSAGAEQLVEVLAADPKASANAAAAKLAASQKMADRAGPTAR